MKVSRTVLVLGRDPFSTPEQLQLIATLVLPAHTLDRKTGAQIVCKLVSAMPAGHYYLPRPASLARCGPGRPQLDDAPWVITGFAPKISPGWDSYRVRGRACETGAGDRCQWSRSTPSCWSTFFRILLPTHSSITALRKRPAVEISGEPSKDGGGSSL